MKKKKANGRYVPRHAGTAAKRKKRRADRTAKLVLTAAALFCLGLLLRSGFIAPNDSGEKPVPSGPQASVLHEGPPYVVAVDAGHGGEDPGAEGVVTEKELTERTAGFLLELLNADEHYIPVRTHEPDTFAKPKQRAETANGAHSALLLSIHGNSAPDYPQTAGFECYPQPPGRAYHEDALRFAHLIAGKMEQAGHSLRGEAGVRYIYYEGSDEEGYEKQIAEESDRTTHDAQTFGLLERAACPAVLAEQCFVTSETDAADWAGEAGCRRAARVYYEAICDYFGTEAVPEA